MASEPNIHRLSDLEAELVRRVEADYREACEAAIANRQRGLSLVLAAHGVLPGARWELIERDGAVIIVEHVAAAPEAGAVERTLALVNGDAPQ